MKKLAFLVLALTWTVVRAQEAPTRCEMAGVLVVDGNAAEWPMEWQQDDDKKFYYNFCADQNNLYVRMKTSDEFVRRKIALYGFTLWMDPSGKKKKKLGLRFPTGQEGQERMETMRAAMDPNVVQRMSTGEKSDLQKKLNKELVADLEMIELVGLADNPLTSTRSGITTGLKVAISVDDQGAYVYEALVPFKSFRLSAANLEELGVGLETGRFVNDQKSTGKGAGQGRQMSAGGYGGANSMSRGQGYRGPGAPPEMTSPTSVWSVMKMK